MGLCGRRQGEGAVGPGKGYEAPQLELQPLRLAPVITRSQPRVRRTARRHSPYTRLRNVGRLDDMDSTM